MYFRDKSDLMKVLIHANETMWHGEKEVQHLKLHFDLKK